MSLDDPGKQVDRPGVVAFVGSPGCISHLFDHHKQIRIGLFDHLPNGLAGCCRMNAGCLPYQSQLNVFDILSDSSDVFLALPCAAAVRQGIGRAGLHSPCWPARPADHLTHSLHRNAHRYAARSRTHTANRNVRKSRGSNYAESLLKKSSNRLGLRKLG